MPWRWRKGLTGLAAALGLLAAVAVIGTVTAVHADFALEHWQFFKPVALPAGLDDGQLVELALDREVYLESSPGETDLRLVAGQDREAPYQLVKLEKRELREPVAVEIRDLGHVEGEYNSFVADVGAGGNLHNEVVVDTRAHNFRRTVVVETSADGETWAVAQESGEIYDFTSSDEEFRVHHTSVKYPQSAARYLRVKVLHGGEGPLEIIGATVFRAEEVAAKEREYFPVSASSSRDEAGTSYHELDMGVRGVPLSRLSFQSNTPNFHRGAEIRGSDDGEEWQWLGGSHIYSFDTPKFDGRLLEVEFSESRHRYYRLEVDDADNAPLQLTGFILYGADRILRFEAQQETEYALYYGNPVAEAPVYDLQRIVPYLETEDLPVATLGEQRLNAAFTGPDVPMTERLPWLMTAGVALAALVVAVLLFGVIRQAKKVLPPPGEESAS